MNLLPLAFYLTAALVLITTAVALTRRDLVQAVLYLILSFVGTAALLYLFGAPLVAALHVIIYAGAILVLFLLVVAMANAEGAGRPMYPLSQWLPAAAIALGYVAVALLIRRAGPGGAVPLGAAEVPPREFAQHVFQRHWLSIEIVSLLLLVALAGVLLLGRGSGAGESEEAP